MKKVITFAVIILIAISGVSFIAIGSQPVSSDASTRNFVINQGDGIRSISRRLEINHFIKNQYIFMFYAYKMGLNTRLQAGLFKLSPSWSTDEIINRLSAGGTQDYWLKIIGGQRLAELPVKFPADQEGYIFPDSYLIPQKYTNEEILSVIKKNFDDKFTQAKVKATNTGLSDHQTVILASLLEREARTLNSKQQIAGILLNRLKINMALQVDATVQYARDTRVKPKDYWTPVTKNDLSINSPYNTYKNTSLPPGPICNPGSDSLYAAFHPLDSDNFYYITDDNGVMHYAKTLDEHNQNIAKYLK